MHLLLARQGQSTTNAANVFTGWSDPALTANGENEARAIADAIRRNGLEPKTIFSSNLSRARRSAEIVKEALGLHVQIQCSAALNERDYGKLTGCNKDEIAARYGRAKLQAWRRSWEAVPPGGESLRDTAARVLGHYVRSILPATLEQFDADRGTSPLKACRRIRRRMCRSEPERSGITTFPPAAALSLRGS